MPFNSQLPIDVVLPRLTATLREHACAVLVAPPGAGKTTRVPLVLLDEPWVSGKILLLEPRRLAARAAAARMAATSGEEVGETVGLRVRFGSKISRRTRIEVVTEGVFTRLILDDPGLEGVSAVLFDEFHERSLDADLGLALARDVQQGLRDDLKLLVMSATIDGARVAKLLGDAPVIESAGRAFPVETRYLPRDPRDAIERPVAAAVTRALQADKGSVLVFLPGAAEIRRTATLLQERISDPTIEVHALYGALDLKAQDQAIAPTPPGRRKIVLATSIAETSLTIEGVSIVIDSGLARVPRYEPDVGLTRLETVRVSRAAADQRRGRAGRTEPGICYRLWDEPQTAALEPYAKPEILAADLTGFVLDLAHWGVADPATLAFLDTPPQPAIIEARALLLELGAIDADGRITEEGRLLQQLPLPPRLARMIIDAAREGAGGLAAEIAVILVERGLGGNDIDLRHRIDELRRDRSQRGQEARKMAERWASLVKPELSPQAKFAPSPLEGEGWGGGSKQKTSPTRRAVRTDLPLKGGGEGCVGALLALAYPDRIAKNRGGGTNSFLLVNGRGTQIDPASALAREPFLAVAELVGKTGQSRILLAAAITLAEIETRFAGRIESREDVFFDKPTASLRGRRSRRLGAIVLQDQAVPVGSSEETARVLAAGIAQLGLDRLPWNPALTQWRDRVMFLRRSEGEEWPDLSDAALAETVDDWLTPFLADKTSLGQLSAADLATALESLLPFALRRRIESEAPTHFSAPTGSRVPIEYTEEGPKLSIRVQELFGLDRHPTIAGGRIPLIIELLSPAQRPVQVTRDLPSFWRGSYAAVKSEMRGRYPKHPWPDNPAEAAPTRRAKPRKD
ncbi:MAG: ATP-dependent helicase HrpB [Alphaproteobacteria bacterium]|jgi:ATP-dependent helicase HrpB|nr:ATP-dependent helicase HrpB [Alphaproteobacteria bacterium]